MRQLKFRAWNSFTNIMVSAAEMGHDELSLHPNGRGFFNPSPVAQRLSQYYEHLIPMQYIGLNDRNGLEIYEGDICMYGDKVVQIAWDNQNAKFVNLEITVGEEFKMDLTQPAKDHNLLEIVGNIYENPELIKDTK